MNMDGIQKTLVLALTEMAAAVRDGKYGKGDAVDADAFREDLEEIADAAE